MILWTVQHLGAYERLMETGVYSGDSEHICFEEFRTAYAYMTNQMIKRGLNPPEGVKYPVWAWYQLTGKRKRRDLRYKGAGTRGEKMVQLEIDIPDEEVLLSDFETWHYVLNNWYLYLSEEECDNNKGIHTNEEYETRWEVIFDALTEVSEDCYYTFPLEYRTIQACFWQLKKEQVRKAIFFTAR